MIFNFCFVLIFKKFCPALGSEFLSASHRQGEAPSKVAGSIT